MIKKILYPILIPISWLYGFIIWLRNKLYDKKWIKSYSFSKPIISIGNITTGGTGKTPLVIYLAQLIIKNGKRPGIISRGYGRKSKGLKIVHDGKKIKLNSQESGDEPYLTALTLQNIPVIVSEKRVDGIKLLIDYFFVDIIIMDDGFQNRKIIRDLDIITISSFDKKSDYKLLPYGNLREPYKNINRADCIIYTKTENNQLPNIHTEFKLFNNIPYTLSYFNYILFKYVNAKYKKTFVPNNEVFIFCGIAQPESFIKYVKNLSINIGGIRLYNDHQKYTPQVIENLIKQIKTKKITSIITTEKDLVKLPDIFLKSFDVYIIKIDMYFKNDQLINNFIKFIFLK